MPKLRVRPDAPGSVTVGPITGPDWQPGEERDIASCLCFDIDRLGFAPIADETLGNTVLSASVATATRERVAASRDGRELLTYVVTVTTTSLHANPFE